MNAKTCPGCGQHKALSEYYTYKATGKPHPRCKECKKRDQRNYGRSKTGTQKIKAYRQENKDRRNEQRRTWYRRLKAEAIEAYGSRCTCCGESQSALLCFDHVDNDGSEHRALIAQGFLLQGRVRTSPKFVVWLREHGYPPQIQLLCFNCNIGKAFNGGQCPHVGFPML